MARGRFHMSASCVAKAATKVVLFVVVVVILVASAGMVDAAMTDPATGIDFSPSLSLGERNLKLFGVGVRRKGPIKVYSVGMYTSTEEEKANEEVEEAATEEAKEIKEEEEVGESVEPISSTTDRNSILSAIQAKAKSGPTSFVLKMNFKVGAEKIASSLAESVSPRYNGNADKVNDLKKTILNGVLSNTKDAAAVKGTEFRFDCTENGIRVCVNGQLQDTIPSAELGKAFCDVYLDDDAVSPALKDSCVENFESEK